MELKGKIAILTGASRGIGVFLAEALAAKGVHLALAARNGKDLDATASRLEGSGVRVITVPTDVTELESLKGLVSRTTDELGAPDLLVNNAGIEHYARFQEYDIELIARIMQTNVVGPQWLTRLVLPGMVDRRVGHVVNIASVAGKTAVPFNSVYSASKHALVGFSWSLREEMRPHGVGVSVVCPGFVSDSGMFSDWSVGRKPPGLAGSVSPQLVAAKTIAAIEKNKAEVIVAPGVMKGVDVLHAISPELTTAIARRSGSYRFLEETALRAWEER